tara:strand:- start:140 stop:268 length:129 start_codon:yes stop_codon:yes gene_type:complete
MTSEVLIPIVSDLWLYDLSQKYSGVVNMNTQKIIIVNGINFD